MHKKTFTQQCLNKVIDRCLAILGNGRATVGQQEFALKLLNRAYAKSGANVHIHSFGNVREEQ